MPHLLIIILLFVAVHVEAATKYVRSGSSGANDGTTWYNAWTSFADVSWVRGNTYYVAGGNYDEAVTISTAASGTTRITIKKANATDNGGDAGWSPNYASSQARLARFVLATPYITVDGVSGTGSGPRGILVTNQAYTTVVNIGANIGNISLLNIEMAGIPYQVSTDISDGVYSNNSVAQKGYVISNCWIHDVDRNGITLGGVVGTSFSDYGALIEGNVIERTGGCLNLAAHGQGIQMCFNSEDKFTIIRNNVFRDILGTSDIAFLGGANAVHHDCLIYNNIFTTTPGDIRWLNSPGVISSFSGALVSNICIFNNTFYGLLGTNVPNNKAQIVFSGNTLQLSNIVANNIWENCNFTTAHLGVDFEFNNAYYGNLGTGPSVTVGQIDGVSTTFADTSTFRLVAGGYAIDGGFDLSAYFTTDFAGTARTVPWDIGAYEYTEASPTYGPALLWRFR